MSTHAVCRSTGSRHSAWSNCHRMLRKHSTLLQYAWIAFEKGERDYIASALTYAALEHVDRLAGPYPPSLPVLEHQVAQDEEVEAYRSALRYLRMLDCLAAREALRRFGSELRFLIAQGRVRDSDAFGLAAVADDRDLCVDIVAGGYDGADMPAFTATDAPHTVSALQGALANPDGLAVSFPQLFEIYLEDLPAKLYNRALVRECH